ncbi:disease resistance protein SUMM2-like [Panicum virgatum]|nr:disease resistance protein SUMM2-like [Panicum virgatum]
MPSGYWDRLMWCHVERCPNLDTIFPAEAIDFGNQLQTIWASDLQMARCIWSQGVKINRHMYGSFENLQHLHLRYCPRLQFALPVWVASFPNLETLHIIRCGDLTHVFALNKRYPEEIVAHGLPFPKLTTIHLHDLPKLRQIFEVKMLAPALKTIRIRGCFGLRRLPALQGRKPGVKRPAVEMEKDVWDALEWDGLAAGHHPSLFEPPVHSRYYRRRRLLRGTVLR